MLPCLNWLFAPSLQVLIEISFSERGLISIPTFIASWSREGYPWSVMKGSPEFKCKNPIYNFEFTIKNSSTSFGFHQNTLQERLHIAISLLLLVLSNLVISNNFKSVWIRRCWLNKHNQGFACQLIRWLHTSCTHAEKISFPRMPDQ